MHSTTVAHSTAFDGHGSQVRWSEIAGESPARVFIHGLGGTGEAPFRSSRAGVAIVVGDVRSPAPPTLRAGPPITEDLGARGGVRYLRGI